MSLGSKIVELRNKAGLTRVQLAETLQIPHTTLRNYEQGTREPGHKFLVEIAKFFNVSTDYLLDNATLPHPDLLPVQTVRVPLLGDIACGEPIFADEDLSATMTVNAPIVCDYALRCRGDSMVDARILDGDTVFIRKQDVVDDGAIAAVLIDDEATLKRVYHLADGRIELRAANVRYAPIIVGGEAETRTVRILGKAVGFQSAFV